MRVEGLTSGEGRVIVAGLFSMFLSFRAADRRSPASSFFCSQFVTS